MQNRIKYCRLKLQRLSQIFVILRQHVIEMDVTRTRWIAIRKYRTPTIPSNECLTIYCIGLYFHLLVL